MNEISEIPLNIEEENHLNTYPIKIEQWPKLQQPDKDYLQEIFLVPYQGKSQYGRIIWGVKINRNNKNITIYQGVFWEKIMTNKRF